jgi:hypothetical protein
MLQVLIIFVPHLPVTGRLFYLLQSQAQREKGTSDNFTGIVSLMGALLKRVSKNLSLNV